MLCIVLLGIQIFIAAVTEESVKRWIETEKAVILSPGQGTHCHFKLENDVFHVTSVVLHHTVQCVCV